MARPKVPLISKRATLEAALRIIDEEGLDALSIRRLASEFDVNGASLYHHFRNKDEILRGAALLALEEGRKPKPPDVDWREWFIEQSRFYRRVLLNHPALVNVILMQHPHRIAMEFYDYAVRTLLENGVPRHTIIPLLESMEAFTFGSVLYATAATADVVASGDPFKALGQAERYAAYHVDDDRLWEIVARSILDAVVKADPPRRRATRRKVSTSV